jgi:histidyl-tRNA synthetase
MPLRSGVFILNKLIAKAEQFGCEEIVLPSIEPTELYVSKAGDEVLSQMYTFQDKGEREICLRPEGTATCQCLAREVWKQTRDKKLWYDVRCWRYERPQAGRYREFTQFGVEWLNPRLNPASALIDLAEEMVKEITSQYAISRSVKRGLAYYVEDGFEIVCEQLGAQKQVCGGGTYAEGCGFAFGIDRLMLV